MLLNCETYVINLLHRSDRMSECQAELLALNFNLNLVRFVQARRTLRNGLIGCGLSHAYALSRFLFESESDFCLILEDDFHVIDSEKFRAGLDAVLACVHDWDVVLLASNQAVPVANTQFEGVFRVHGAQTASAYLIRRGYAPKLLRLFYESADKLSELLVSMDKRAANYFYGSDMIWKTFQLHDRFLAFLPALCVQRKSFSDIEMHVVDHGV